MRAAIASRLGSAALINFRAAIAKQRESFAFWFWPALARFMQETERSVSYPRERKDDRGRSKNGAYRLLGANRQERAGTAHRQRQGQSEGHQDLEVQDGGGRQVPSRQLHPQPRALHRRRAAGTVGRRHRAQPVGSFTG